MLRACLIFIQFFCFAVAVYSQVAKNGIADLRGLDFQKSDPIALDGYWKFYPDHFIGEKELQTTNPDSISLISVPLLWSKTGRSSKGYGTYELKIISDSINQLGIRVQDIYSAYSLYINGKYFPAKSIAGAAEDAESPYREVKVFGLDQVDGDTATIRLQVSNFIHSKGGIGSSVIIGIHDQLVTKKSRQDLFDGFLAGCLVMAAVFFLGLYFFGRREKVALYFALFCFAYAYRIVGWGNYLFHDVVELPYSISIRMEYASFYLCGFFFANYIRNLFPSETPKVIVRSFGDFSLLWAGLTLLPVYIFTQLNIAFLIAMLAGIAVISVIYIRATLNKRIGANYSVVSTFGLFLIFGSKTMNYFNLLDEPVFLTAIGQLVFFLFQSLILIERFSMSWKEAKDKAEEAARSKSDFLSVMSHEIRTPLNAVIGTTYHLIEESPRKDQLVQLKNLKLSSENLLSLINNILDFSKIDAGKVEFEQNHIKLKEYTQRTLELFKIPAENKGLSLQFRYDDQLPEIVILDKLRLNQILSNLITNAIKFTDSGYVRLKITHDYTNNSRSGVRFSVEDTGIGIEESMQESIFEAFQQAYSSTTRKYGGTGLGLSITRKLVEMMGGKLEISSKLGYGAKFIFTLNFPIGDPAKIKSQTDNTFDLKGLKILLVEDNEMNVMVATNILKKWNVEIDLAENGLIAVEKAEKTAYDCILMDLQMPEMDGYEATRQIRAMGFKKPIIALTASAMLDKTTKMAEVGLDGAVTKPFNPKDLFQAITEKLFHSEGLE